MRACVYLFVCVAVAHQHWTRGEEIASSESNYYGSKIQPLDLKADRETVNYFLPRLAAKYRPNNDWNVITDPRFYLLTEMESRDVDGYQQPQNSAVGEERFKRQGLNNGPSLSIVNSLDVLRNRLLLEITRKQQQEGINRNRNLLSSVGKRTPPLSSLRRFGSLGYAGGNY